MTALGFADALEDYLAQCEVEGRPLTTFAPVGHRGCLEGSRGNCDYDTKRYVGGHAGDKRDYNDYS